MTENVKEKLIRANSAEEIASLLEEFDLKALKMIAGNEYMNINRRLGKKNFIKEMAKILWDRYEQVDAGGIIAVMGFMGLPTVLETSLINGRKEYNAAKATETTEIKEEESEMTKNTIKTTEELSSAFEAVKTDVQFSEAVTEDTRAIKDLTEMFNLVDKFNNMPRHEHQAVFDAQESLFTKKLYSGKDAEQVFYYTASYLAYLSRLNEYERSEFIRQYNKAKILKIYASALMNKKSVPTTKTGCVKVILEILRQYDACKARKKYGLTVSR